MGIVHDSTQTERFAEHPTRPDATWVQFVYWGKTDVLPATFCPTAALAIQELIAIWENAPAARA